MDVVSFYADDDNLIAVLEHWLAIFSEGYAPIVPIVYTDGLDGPIERRETFDAPCFRDFPATEKEKWLRAEDNA